MDGSMDGVLSPEIDFDAPQPEGPLLLRGKLFPLGDDVKVLSGHGPVTTIGLERKGNPYLS